MISSTALSYFFGFWTIVYVFDYGLKSTSFTRQKYTDIIKKCGLTISPLCASFFTTRLNLLFSKICKLDRIPWRIWFTIGTLFTVLAMLFSLGLLSILIYNTFSQTKTDNPVITTVVPGVNLPLNHLWIYFVTLLLCAILHESGHAIAALCERVRLQGFGVSLYGIYPAAYVNLNSEDLFNLSPMSQLRIYSAGVWHNFIIALLAVIVFYQLPFFLYPVFVTGSGVGVAYLEKDSVISGTRGLSLGDSIIRINSCSISNQSDWIRCLEEAHSRPVGYCVSGSYLNTISPYRSSWQRSLKALAATKKDQDAKPIEKYGPQLALPPKAVEVQQVSRQDDIEDCCPPDRSSTHMCFLYNPTFGSNAPNRSNKTPARVCLPARSVTERKTCYSIADCSPSASLAEGFPVTTRPICVLPSPSDNLTRLVRLQHKRGVGLFPQTTLPGSIVNGEAPESDPVAILFLGPIKELHQYIGVTDYAPRWPHLPLSPQLPVLVQTFCSYLFSLSGALLLVNVVPCYMLDGQWILGALLELILPCASISARTQKHIYNLLIWLGTGLFLVNLILALRLLILQNLNNVTF